MVKIYYKNTILAKEIIPNTVFLVPTSSQMVFSSSLEIMFNYYFQFKKDKDFRKRLKQCRIGSTCIFYSKKKDIYLIFLVLLDHFEQYESGVFYNDMHSCLIDVKYNLLKLNKLNAVMNKLGDGKFLKFLYENTRPIMNLVFDDRFIFLVCSPIY